MSKKEKKNGKKLLLIVGCVLLAAAMLILLSFRLKNAADVLPGEDDDSSKPTEMAAVSNLEDVQINMANGLQILDIGSYTGLNVEGDTTQFVTDILMLVIKNAGTDYIQYAEIELYNDGVKNYFNFSTLAPGQTLLVLDKDQTPFPENTDFAGAAAVANNLAVFQKTPVRHEEELEIQLLNGAMNVTNISGENISGEIVIYYKNKSVDIYYGGITYRTRIEGGLKAGEIKQIMLNTVYEAGTEIMYVDIVQ